MTAAPELSGVDLARQALFAAREAAKKCGSARQDKPRRRTWIVPRDGRDPLGLGATITMMMTERGLVDSAAGGSVLAQFDEILAAVVPELAGRVQAMGFDADTGRLDVASDAPAYGTKVRWCAPKLITAANEKMPGAFVRTVNVLPPACRAATLASSDESAPPAALAPQPVKTCETASAGFGRALEAHFSVAASRQEDPAPGSAVG
ncbi:DUF721 domain-containing protein [Streptomyces sp. NPDC094049]|uniref:DUF721 domain-containing protein n=1 Tax=Streptomyces sp. NPDC094049 TaxID=3154987 RepID=UPI003320F2F1